MAKNNRPETYRGRRRKLNVLGIVLSAVAVLIVVLFVLFGSFQKYIVYGNNGISIELPILATPGAAEDEGERSRNRRNRRWQGSSSGLTEQKRSSSCESSFHYVTKTAYRV